MLLSYALPPTLTPVIWGLGLFLASIGLLALASPRHFAALSRFGSRWVDTSAVLSKLDRRVDVDDKLLPHSRLLGASVLAAMGLVWMTFHR